MGRWWTGYTSIAGDRACIFHSHGVLWRFASPCCRQSSHGYGLFEATIPSEKMRWIHSLRGAECESGDSPRAISTFLYHGDGLRGALIYYPQRAGTRLHKGRSPWHEYDAHHANTLLDLEDLKTVLVMVKKKRQKFSPHLRFLPHCTCALRHAIAPPYLATCLR